LLPKPPTSSFGIQNPWREVIFYLPPCTFAQDVDKEDEDEEDAKATSRYSFEPCYSSKSNIVHSCY